MKKILYTSALCLALVATGCSSNNKDTNNAPNQELAVQDNDTQNTDTQENMSSSEAIEQLIDDMNDQINQYSYNENGVVGSIVAFDDLKSFDLFINKDASELTSEDATEISEAVLSMYIYAQEFQNLSSESGNLEEFETVTFNFTNMNGESFASITSAEFEENEDYSVSIKNALGIQ